MVCNCTYLRDVYCEKIRSEVLTLCTPELIQDIIFNIYENLTSVELTNKLMEEYVVTPAVKNFN